jgi:hypothetical protein
MKEEENIFTSNYNLRPYVIKSCNRYPSKKIEEIEGGEINSGDRCMGKSAGEGKERLQEGDNVIR